MRLTEKLISLRKQKGLSQLDVAEQLHVSRQAISRWEVGAAVPSTDNLKYLSELYGVSVDYLLHDDAELPGKPAEPKAAIPEEQPKEVLPQAENKRKHSYIFIGALGIVLAIVIGIAIYLAAFPKEEQERIRPIEELSSETKSQSDETFCFE